MRMKPGLWTVILVLVTLGSCGAGTIDDLYHLREAHSARMSSYDRSGGNADARPIAPGATLTLADLQGPGCIRHIWVTIASDEDAFLRKLALRMYWDGEENPSVEAPVGDFFGVGHGIVTHYISLPLAMITSRGFNCYFPMPFNKSARITVTNDGQQPVGAFYYHVDYETYDRPLGPDAAYFHARWHRENPTTATDGSPNTTGADNYVILEARGRGHYVGCNYSVHQLSGGWWGEGDDMMFIDGEQTPSIIGTGSEDYFNSAWGFGHEYAGNFLGCTVVGRGEALADKTCVYRYHILDPVHFSKSIRVTIEHGHANDRSDDVSSQAYWYQTEPHYNWSPLPPVAERVPRTARQPKVVAGAIEGESLVPAARAEGGEVSAQPMAAFGYDWSGDAQLWYRSGAPGGFVAVPVHVDTEGDYEVVGHFTKARDYGVFQLEIDGKPLGQPFDGYNDGVIASPEISFGKVHLAAGDHEFRFEVTGKNVGAVGCMIGVDYLLLKPM